MLIRDIEGNLGYYYIDDYMFFYFAGTYSKKYRLFITNEQQGYKWYTSTGASIKVEKPLYQEYTYYIGTNRSQKNFDLNVAAENLSDEEIKEMLLWLQEGQTGFLSVDWNKDWGYDVVLSQVTDPEFHTSGRNNVIIFKLTFQTIGEFRARATWDVTAYIDEEFTYTQREAYIGNGYGIPEIDVRAITQTETGITSITYLPTIGNEYSYIDCECSGKINNFEISKWNQLNGSLYKDKTYINYGLNNEEDINLLYNGKSGYVLFDGSSLLEATNKINAESELISDVLRLKGVPPKRLFPKIEVLLTDANNYTIKLIFNKKDAEFLSYINDLYISLSVPCMVSSPYGAMDYDKNSDLSYYNWIAYLPLIENGENNNYKSIIDEKTRNVEWSTATEVELGFIRPFPNEFQGNEGLDLFIKNAKVYCGSYNIIQVSNQYASHSNSNIVLTVHKYNNL